LRFKVAHESMCIGQWTFETLKPFYVKPMQDQNTCYCIYHVELNELQIGFNHMCNNGNFNKVSVHPKEECQASFEHYNLV